MLYALYHFQNRLNRKQVICPISNKEYKGFVRRNSQLITWDNEAKNRHRLIWLFLQNETKLFDTRNSLLHIAPEYCFYKEFYKNKLIEYVPVDKFEDGYDYFEGVVNEDLTNLSFKSNSFDFILCNHVLEHIQDDLRAIQEIYRVLKPDGIAIITVPIDMNRKVTYEDDSIVSPKDRKMHFGQWDHVRLYASDITTRFTFKGFDEVELVQYADVYSKQEYTKYGLSTELILVAKKIDENDS